MRGRRQEAERLRGHEDRASRYFPFAHSSQPLGLSASWRLPQRLLAYSFHLSVCHRIMIVIRVSDMLDQPVRDLYSPQVERERRDLVSIHERLVRLHSQIL